MSPTWPDVPGIAFGGDYNPEQWPASTWEDDVRLMQRAGVNLVTVGVFAWAALEPAEGHYDFGWLERVIELLHAGGIGIDLATATASPPPWFGRAYPETLPRTADGTLLSWGSRQAFCPSSPRYRQAASCLAESIARHFAGHPALRLWHVHNEYGCHNAHCYCDTSAAAFRQWLASRYGDVDALNDAWATSFWAQRYGSFEEILPPRATPTFTNPAQQLDFWRFSSAELLACYRSERDVLRAITPSVPVTTNFMDWFKPVDYFAWAGEVDLVANDNYLIATDPAPHIRLALAADLTRSLAGCRPWLLMEHSTSAVNWQRRNQAKAPGQLSRNSLAHLARGADGLMFFQWRASRAGAEKFHSGMLPHAGTETKVWQEVCALGANLQALAAVRGSTVCPQVALLFDWESWWATELAAHPSADVACYSRVREYYDALWTAGITTNIAHPSGDLDHYRLLLAPTLYAVSDATTTRLTEYVLGGGTLVVGYFSGIVDEHDQVYLGGYPGALRDLLGVHIEEFFPLLATETVQLSDGTSGRIWSELGRATTAEVLASYASGPTAGSPAITRNPVGAGSAWYVGTSLDQAATAKLMQRICAEAGVHPATGEIAPPHGLEVVRRGGPARSYLFAINHATTEAMIPASGTDLLNGRQVHGQLRVPAGEVVVLAEDGHRR